MGCASSVPAGPSDSEDKRSVRRVSVSRPPLPPWLTNSSSVRGIQNRWGSKFFQRTLKVEAENNRYRWQGIWTIPIDLFADASDDCCRAVAEHLQPRYLSDGEILFQDGDAGTSMFFVNRCGVRVLRNSLEIAKLGVGAYFGELGLMLNDGRTATIMATGRSCELLELLREDFYRVSLCTISVSANPPS